MTAQTFKKLKKEFDAKVAKLQKSCPHKRKKTKETHWSFGHKVSYEARACTQCNKLIECKKETEK